MSDQTRLDGGFFYAPRKSQPLDGLSTHGTFGRRRGRVSHKPYGACVPPPSKTTRASRGGGGKVGKSPRIEARQKVREVREALCVCSRGFPSDRAKVYVSH